MKMPPLTFLIADQLHWGKLEGRITSSLLQQPNSYQTPSNHNFHGTLRKYLMGMWLETKVICQCSGLVPDVMRTVKQVAIHSISWFSRVSAGCWAESSSCIFIAARVFFFFLLDMTWQISVFKRSYLSPHGKSAVFLCLKCKRYSYIKFYHIRICWIEMFY